MIYSEQIKLGGKWVKAAELKQGIKAKIVSETKPMESQFLNKDGSKKFQDVAKVQFEGFPEPLNVNLNRPTINALINAFGVDSVKWQNQTLMVETEKVKVAGKTVVALYLVPQGYKKIDDENGYTIIIKDGTNDLRKQDEMHNPNFETDQEDDIKPEDLPF